MDLNLDRIKNHPSWLAVEAVCRVLKSRGHQALLAGGCVRDGIIGRTPKDFDVATDAKPEEVETYFEKTIDIGRSFGVMIVPLQGSTIEVTTFRKDGTYKDGRHPESVEFSSAEEDAKRRDFTINGLFYDLDSQQVLDFVGGQADLGRRLIRAVGNPAERFQEDQLRTLRAIRFAAELDFEIEPQTWKALLLFRHKISNVSAERITEELRKILQSQNPLKGFLLLKESLFLDDLWPSLSFLQSEHYTRLFYKSLQRLSGDLRLEMFLSTLLLFEVYFEMEHVGMNYRVGVDRQLEELSRFRFPRDVTRAVAFCLRSFQEALNLDTKSLALLSEPYGVQLFDLVQIFCDSRGEKQKELEKFRQRYLELCNKSGLLPDRWVSGDDLEKLKIPRGPVYAEILEKAYLMQLEGQFENKKLALEWIKTNWRY